MEASLLESRESRHVKWESQHWHSYCLHMQKICASLQAVLLLVLKTHRGYFSTTWAEREENIQAESFTHEPDVCV